VSGSPYTIVPSAASGTGLGNYSINYVNGALTVNAATLTVTAKSTSKTYGAAVTFAGTEFNTSGLLNSDSVSSVTLTSTGAASTATVSGSPYTIVPSAASGTGLGNYSINYVNGALTVTTASLTVAVNPATSVYGAAFPTFTGTVTGVLNGDGITASYSTMATPTSPVGGSYTITASLNDPNSKLGNYSVSNTAAALTITKALLTVTVNPASSVYGAAFPTFTGTVSGVVPGDAITASYSTTATPTSPAGGNYTITATVIDPNSRLGDYSVSNTPATLTITQATPTVSLTSNSNPVLVQNLITLTATVSSGVSTPTGSVTFLDGTTPIGTGTLNASGVATLAIPTLGVGSHSITAAYSGDTNFVASLGSILTQLVQDFNLDISISGPAATTGVTTVTASPGRPAVYTFTLSPVGSTTFPTTIVLSASGLPAGATYTFSPATLAAGSGSTQVTLTINLPQVAAANTLPALHHSASHGESAQSTPSSKLPFLALALLLLPFSGRMRRASRKLGRMFSLLLLLIAGLAALTGLSGCGGGTSGYFGQAPATYTITVTGTAGALIHSTSVTLIVE
jgi:hypothetical protein